MMPAGDGVVGIAYRAFGKARAAVAAAVFYRIQAAGPAQVQDVLPQQLDCLVLAVPDVAAGLGRVPVVAKTQFRFQPVSPRSFNRGGIGPLKVKVRHVRGSAFHQVQRDFVEVTHSLNPQVLIGWSVVQYNIVNRDEENARGHPLSSRSDAGKLC